MQSRARVRRFAAAPNAMLRPHWRRGLREAAARALHFELQVFPGRFRYALDLIDAFPNLCFVLLHAGMPEDASPEGRACWAAGLARLAERTNIVIKLSGLGTFVRRCTIADWRPVIDRLTIADQRLPLHDVATRFYGLAE